MSDAYSWSVRVVVVGWRVHVLAFIGLAGGRKGEREAGREGGRERGRQGERKAGRECSPLWSCLYGDEWCQHGHHQQACRGSL